MGATSDKNSEASGAANGAVLCRERLVFAFALRLSVAVSREGTETGRPRKECMWSQQLKQ